MALATLQETLELPGGASPSGAVVTLRLVATDDGNAVAYAGSLGVLWAETTVVASDGSWSIANLRPNTGVSGDVITSPANTAYQVRVKLPSGAPVSPRYVRIPDSVGPHDVADVLVVDPGAILDSAVEQTIYARTGLGPGVYLYDGLKNWHYSSKLIRDIACFGDSLTGVGYTYGWGKLLRQRLNIELNGGDIGDGVKPQRHPDWSYAGGLTWPFMPTSDTKDQGLMGTRYTGTLVTDGGPGVRATFTPPAGTVSDLIDIYWIDGGLLVFGNWRYSKDGGSTWSNLDATSGHVRNGFNGLQSFTITGPITGSFIIEASTNGSNTVGCAFTGIGLRSSSVTRGARLHEWGAGGRYLADLMRTTSGNALGMLGEVTPDLAIVMFSNDALLNSDPTNFGNLLTNLVGGARVFYNDLMDFVFVCPPEQGAARAGITETQAAYRAKTKEIAQTLGGVAVLDLAEAWGTYDEAYDAGYMDADLIHLSEAGNIYIADQLARMIQLGDGPTTNQTYLLGLGDDLLSTPGKFQAQQVVLPEQASAPTSPAANSLTVYSADSSGTTVLRTKDSAGTVSTLVSSVSGTAPIVSSGGATPAISITAASTSASGAVELATSAETQTGSDTTRAVTPAGLAATTATETRAGVVELATTAEATTGTDTARAVTPAGLDAYVDAILAGNVTIGGDLTVDDDLLTVSITQAKVTLDLDTDGSAVLNSYVGSEAQPRLTVGYVGGIGVPVLTFGPGGAAVPDTTFYRSGVAALTLVGTLALSDATAATHALNRQTADARYVPSMFIDSFSWGAVTGSPARASYGTALGVALFYDAAAVEKAVTIIDVPPSWQTFRVDAWWTNAGAGSGNVVWATEARWIGDTDDLDTVSSDTATVTVAAPSRDVTKVTTLDSSVTRTAGKRLVLHVQRTGTSGSDTLANDAGLIGIDLVRLT